MPSATGRAAPPRDWFWLGLVPLLALACRLYGLSEAQIIQDEYFELFSGQKFDNLPAQALRGLADEIVRQTPRTVVALVGVTNGKASLVVSLSKDLEGELNAVDLVRAGVAELGGKGGGGRPDFAQGGGPDGKRADAALTAIERHLAGHAAAAE